MNYYIRGDAANADKIRAAFEKNGVDTLDFGLDNKAIVYFSIGGCVQCMPYNINIMNIIKTHPDYKELELPVEHKFEVGDWIVYEDGNTFAGGSKSVQVKAVEDDRYIFTHNTNGSVRFIDRNCRLWSIADAKDGDVLATEDYIFIFKHILHGGVHLYCHYDIDDEEFDSDIPDAIIGNIHDKGAHFQPVAKEQRGLFFTKMREAGYQWDSEKKELRKIKPHYDISNFKPYQKVLIRFGNNDTWRADFFSHIKEDRGRYFVGIGYANKQCIPFEGNEHLLGTTDMCAEEYINW